MAKVVLIVFFLLFSIFESCAFSIEEIILSAITDKINTLENSVENINERLKSIEKLIEINEQIPAISNNDANRVIQKENDRILKSNIKFKKGILFEKKYVRSMLNDYGNSLNELKKDIKKTITEMNDTIRESHENLDGMITQLNTESNEHIDEKVTEILIKLKTVENDTTTEQHNIVSELAVLQDRVTDIEKNQTDQNNTIYELQARTTALNSQRESDIRSLKNRVRRLHGQKVGFHARLSVSKEYRWLSTIVFDKVRYNLGVAYSTSTGKFTAPYSGTYLFSMSVAGTSSKPAAALFVIDGSYKMYALSEKGVNVTSSSTCVTDMEKGEQAWVQSDYNSAFSDWRTTFTGVFLY